MANIMKDRDNRILNAAMSIAEIEGYLLITRDAVAKLAECAPATVNNAYGSMRGLRRAVLSAAVERRNLVIVAQGLADRHEIILKAPEDLRQEAALQLMAV